MTRINRPRSEYRRHPMWAAFYHQRRHSEVRGIAWKLTFPAWLEIWTRSGKAHLRGRGAGKYVMARYGDRGPYTVSNVSIVRWEVNARDGNLGRKRSAQARANISAARRYSWANDKTFRKRRLAAQLKYYAALRAFD